MNSALITGINGQDGSYLAELLLSKGYEVHGMVRRSSNNPFLRIPHQIKKDMVIHYGNLRDSATIRSAIEISKPKEIYNLGAQSHVGLSFELVDETWETNYHGLGRLVNEALRFNPQVRIYQASTSEMFGNSPPPQNEMTALSPQSPYAEAKAMAHKDFVNGYRTREGLFICSGFLFNHESPRRGEQFVTRKITKSLAELKLGLRDSFSLGNLDARRDWGFAGDYVTAMWLMLQQSHPDDYVISTGETRSVRDFVNAASMALEMPLFWDGEGINEKARNGKGEFVISIEEKNFRPKEVNFLQGDSSKAKRMLGWEPKTSFNDLVKMMVEHDIAALK